MRALEPDALRAVALRVLEADPDPAVRLRLHRQVFHTPPDHHDHRAARAEVLDSPEATGLLRDRRRDGGWGRFHSEDTGRRGVTPTTEYAVRRGLALGLTGRSRLLAPAAQNCAGLLAGRRPFPDPPERNERWATGWRLFVGATLALLRPACAALQPTLRLWSRILCEAFADGEYDVDREVLAHRRLTGAPIRGSYLHLDNRYAVEILAAAAGGLPPPVVEAYLRWLVDRPDGLRYLGVPLSGSVSPLRPTAIDHWLTSWELIARYPGWRAHAAPVVRWLAARRSPEGDWDLGPRPSRTPTLPLSNDWRSPHARRTDWTTRILCLLSSEARPG